MGSGKSSLAGKLAKKLGVLHVDTDVLVVEDIGMSISDYVSKNGEHKFRQIESSMLLKASRLDCAVISTGGGAILKDANRRILKDTGSTFYLQTSPHICAQRVKLAKNNDRFLLREKERIEDILLSLQKKRASFYLETADFTINTDELSEDEVCALVLSFLGEKKWA